MRDAKLRAESDLRFPRRLEDGDNKTQLLKSTSDIIIPHLTQKLRPQARECKTLGQPPEHKLGIQPSTHYWTSSSSQKGQCPPL
jgi:hypothetical protein